MLWNASAPNGYPIKATDGQLGTVAGLMYEPPDWAIRWLVVDTGDWLSGRRALLPVAALGQPDPESHYLPVKLTMRQVEECPDVDANEPLSEESEVLVCDHYDLSCGSDHFLWRGHDGKLSDVTAPDQPQPLTTAAPAEHEGGRRDSHVRSLSEITGDSIEATDGDIGPGDLRKKIFISKRSGLLRPAPRSALRQPPS